VYGLLTALPQLDVFPSVGLCGGGTYPFSITPYGGYNSVVWSAPAGAIITDAANILNFGNPITTTGFAVNITFPAGFVSGNVTVGGVNGCGAGTVRTWPVRSTPTQSASITGPNIGVCGQTNVMYTAAAVAGAFNYRWTVPAGVNIVGAAADSSWIKVDFTAGYTTAGSICVTPIGTCGLGAIPRCQVVNPRPASTGAISGATTVCKLTLPIQTYTVVGGAGATFNSWTASNGAIITSGNNTLGAITVNYSGATSSTVTLTCRAFNACGQAAAQSTLLVTVNACRTAGSVVASEQLSAYPNPTSGKLNVTFNATSKEKYTLKITDMIGNILVSQANTATEGDNLQELDLSKVAKGMYLLSIQREGAETQTMRIVVE
jgi:hypothetical protein